MLELSGCFTANHDEKTFDKRLTLNVLEQGRQIYVNERITRSNGNAVVNL